MDFKAARTAMVEGQVRTGDVTRRAITEAMMAIPRERFAPRALRDLAYAELQIELAPGRRMLDPRAFAKMLEEARIGADDLVLDVGTATGYSAAIAARMAAAVVALEEDEGMAKQAQALLAELSVDNVIVETGPLTQGAPGSGPYDVILIEGAVAAAPVRLFEQLKEGGRLVAIFHEGPYGHCRVWSKSRGGVSARRAFDADATVLPGFDVAPSFVF